MYNSIKNGATCSTNSNGSMTSDTQPKLGTTSTIDFGVYNYKYKENLVTIQSIGIIVIKSKEQG